LDSLVSAVHSELDSKNKISATSPLTLKFRAVAMFLIVDLWTLFYTELADTFTIYSSNKFHVSRSSVSLVMAISPKAR
jgi:hypothetical protein